MKNYKRFRAKLLKDKKIKKFYEKLGPEFNLTAMLIKKRIEKGLTQKELAQKIRTKQSAISRLESGHYNFSLAFLRKIAKALNAKLEVKIY